MQQQFRLWPDRGPGTIRPLWRDLEEAERAKLIAAFARLIRQMAIRSQKTDPSMEDRHEQ